MTLENASNISLRFLQWEQPVEVSFPNTSIQMSLAQEDLEKLPKDNEDSKQRDGSLFLKPAVLLFNLNNLYVDVFQI